MRSSSTTELIEQLLPKLQARISREESEANLRRFLRERLKPLGHNGKELISEALKSSANCKSSEVARRLRLVLEGYQNVYFPVIRKRVLAPGMELLDSDSRRDLTLRLNQSRGKQYETGLGLWVVGEGIRRLYPRLATQPEIDKRVFKIILPDGRQVKRRADIFILELSAIIEVKSGRIFLSGEVRAQIEKDKHLLKRRQVRHVDWILFGGASAAVLDCLDSANIGFLDLSFGVPT